ncbi:hypothetical protein BHM03_00032776, partial [Ensete ventricosum]
MYIDTDPEEKKDFHHHFQSHPHRRMSVRTRETSAPSIKSLRQLPATKVGDFVVDLTRDLICPNRILDVRYLGTKETTSRSKTASNPTTVHPGLPHLALSVVRITSAASPVLPTTLATLVSSYLPITGQVGVQLDPGWSMITLTWYTSSFCFSRRLKSWVERWSVRQSKMADSL